MTPEPTSDVPRDDDAPPLRVLAISGSLRAVSSNGAVLDALAALAPPGVVVTRFGGLAGLPAFNPDIDGEGATLPAAVAAWRADVAAAQAVVICSPEYAHGVPGALKNALDWLVSGPEVPGLPVAVVNATTRAHHAHVALMETLRTMSADVVEAACVALPLAPGRRTAEALLADAGVSIPLTAVLDALRRAAARGGRLLHGPGQSRAI